MTTAHGLFRPLLAAALGAVLVAQAQISTNVVNDGTSTNTLDRLQNATGRGDPADATIDLSPLTPGPGLLAAQTPFYSDFPINAAWYNRNFSSTNRNYSVVVDAQPATSFPECRVGAMGWIDLTAQTGICFRVRPGADSGNFELGVIRFRASTTEENDSLAGLYDLDGSPAVALAGSANSPLGDYQPTTPATFVLQFSAPTDADRAALTGVTTHVTAQVLQSPDGTSSAVQVGTTLELLSDLPAPAAQRFGYAASWNTILAPGDAVGTFTRLVFIGSPVISLRPPTVTITSPTNNTVYPVAANVVVTADAQAPDTAVAKVEFFQDNQLVGTATNAPYTASFIIIVAGDYSLTAKVTDTTGQTATSAAVAIQVKASDGQAGVFSNPHPSPSATDFQSFQFTLAGSAGSTYVTEATTDFVTWKPVATNTVPAAGTVLVTVLRDAPQAYTHFRASTSGGGTPGDVTLGDLALLPSAVNFQQFQFTIVGLQGRKYRVEATDNLVTWIQVATGTGSAGVEVLTFPRSATGSSLFYRVIVLP